MPDPFGNPRPHDDAPDAAPKIDAATADRFTWGEGDLVIVKRADQNSGVAKSARHVLTDAELRLAEEIDKRRTDES